MKTCDQLQTMAVSYAEICQGEEPWVALGNFMNDWFDYAKDRRAELVVDPILLPEQSNAEMFRWAVFSVASVEWLCEKYKVACPSWVQNPCYLLAEPWFDSSGAHKSHVRERLIQQTPEPFTRRNIYCGNRMFLNKYEFAEAYARRRSA
ncbi:MAG: hypothetical protein ACRDHZ_17435 [Ktedonobacteraceae bacterium]